VARELPWGGLAIGVLAAIVLRHWHGALFGP
jgi:hypothetical protein